ncbi:hypothetical protein CFC21_018408 [Triticum aestivum]|uniref:S-acyltransferase n=3 Tax=Triticum TaxID=4564 RepID=A0A9R1P1S6_TRITD|nr:protein S-acyltransferase 10-like isoform X2 [Triticum aestivum]KAF7003022.1 hypothetical protein CFC21_018408 [Triticum aestivum]VAH35250.1 unnamed protein product [Triticum turgidum subsp. durum]
MPCCGESDPPHEAIRVLSQPQRHGSHGSSIGSIWLRWGFRPGSECLTGETGNLSAGRKPWRCVRLIVMLLHALFIGAVFLLDPALRSQIRRDQWYMCLYGGLVLFTLAQYLYTANSSPGYVADMLKAGSAMHATFINTTTISKQVCSKNGSLNYFMSRSKIEQHNPQSATPSSLLQMMDLYPPGSSSRDLTCSYCHLVQPPRTKHCHDCDKCVLQFDHHCTWLGTCIGVRNHCRFWWYIFGQASLVVWTVALYIQFLHVDMNGSWLKGLTGLTLLLPLIVILIVLLILLMLHTYLALTNQTTYEIARRKRISYLRGVPRKVHPFSKGICRNLYDLCLSRQKGYVLEAVPPLDELEARARPYTCRDVICCRCC